jgi:hypothetical protein
MSEEHKPPVWPWSVTALIALPVPYVASFGPACWWLSKFDSRMLAPPGVAARRVSRFYIPIDWAAIKGPQPLRDAIFWYATLNADSQLAVPADWGGRISWIAFGG